ncbi:MAG TPA: hypothetical protein VK171_05305, partial [Fimbriimonas sp.]|nr:hypothetical protein [Fimbriimonas sp.]
SIIPGPKGNMFPISDAWCKRIEKSRQILLDEISMGRADTVDLIDRKLRQAFDETKPFGGISMVFVGDHFQLEPVVPSQGPEHERWKSMGYPSPFFFDSRVWQESDPKVIELTKIFRQEGDDGFKDALNFIRNGDRQGLPLVNQRAKGLPISGAIKLCFYNRDAQEINDRYFITEGTGEAMEWQSTLEGDWSEESLPSPRILRLKVGHRVIATANGKDAPYANGDLGTVAEITPDTVLVDFDRGFQEELSWHDWAGEEAEQQADLGLEDAPPAKPADNFKQIPLKLAYAISVHKSQGMTLDKVHIVNRGKAFAHGQAYVMLSRCKSLETMTLDRPMTPNDLIVHRRIREWHDQNFAKELVA